MAQQWGLFDGPPRFMNPHTHPATNGSGPEDEDLFNAALLFLDHHEDSHSDTSDTYSVHTAEDPSPYQQPIHSYQQHLHQHPSETLRWDDVQSLDAAMNGRDGDLHVQLRFPTDEPVPVALVDDSASLTLEAFGAPMWNSIVTPPAPPRRINKRRMEIERLRVESQSLQIRLASLQDQSAESKSLATSDRVFGEVLGSAWQNIAARQMDQRHRSESENRRLKNLLNEHKRMAKALRRLLARHANSKTLASSPPQGLRVTHAATKDELDDPEVFDTLKKSLSSMNMRADSILSEPMLATQETSLRDVKSETNGDKSMSLQLLSARTLPFPFAATVDAVWNSMLQDCGPTGLEWERTDQDTFRTAFDGYVEIGDMKGPARGKIVLRRIDEPTRVIILRSALFSCQTNDNPFLRRPVRHCLWKIIRKQSCFGLKMDKEQLCQVVSCVLSTTSLEIDGMDRETRAKETHALAEAFYKITCHQVDLANETIDNMLLKSTMRGTNNIATIQAPPRATQVYC